MVGGTPDRLGPAEFALRQVGRLQQFCQRQDAAKRRADIVRKPGERDLDRARTALAGAHPRPALAFCHESPNPALTRMPRRGATNYTANPTSRRISAGVTPCSRNSRKPVAAVDLASLRPSASKISG